MAGNVVEGGRLLITEVSWEQDQQTKQHLAQRRMQAAAALKERRGAATALRVEAEKVDAIDFTDPALSDSDLGMNDSGCTTLQEEVALKEVQEEVALQEEVAAINLSVAQLDARNSALASGFHGDVGASTNAGIKGKGQGKNRNRKRKAVTGEGEDARCVKQPHLTFLDPQTAAMMVPQGFPAGNIQGAAPAVVPSPQAAAQTPPAASTPSSAPASVAPASSTASIPPPAATPSAPAAVPAAGDALLDAAGDALLDALLEDDDNDQDLLVDAGAAVRSSVPGTPQKEPPTTPVPSAPMKITPVERITSIPSAQAAAHIPPPASAVASSAPSTSSSIPVSSATPSTSAAGQTKKEDHGELADLRAQLAAIKSQMLFLETREAIALERQVQRSPMMEANAFYLKQHAGREEHRAKGEVELVELVDSSDDDDEGVVLAHTSSWIDLKNKFVPQHSLAAQRGMFEVKPDPEGGEKDHSGGAGPSGASKQS